MRVLHVNDTDLRGRAFSGFDLVHDLAQAGVEAGQIVLHKLSDDPAVTPLFEGPADETLNDAVWRVEQRHGMDGVLYPWAGPLMESAAFREADVVHYHLIHNRMISLLDLPALTAAKPSVWTFHDAWPLTGHCIQPLDCGGWRSGCSPCPHLDRWFAMRVDCASQMLELKRSVYAQLDVDVVVSSSFMLDMLRESPLGAAFSRVHLVPFGVRTERYLADDCRVESRKALGIAPDEAVILLRAAPGELKGTDLVLRALSLRGPARPTAVLALDGRGLLGGLRQDYRVVELGWASESTVAQAYSACDVFVMPSRGESFGLMALEAMSSGRPVVCLEGTAVASVVDAPTCGVAVPDSPQALRDAIDALLCDPQEAASRGELGRIRAATAFSHDGYISALYEIYIGALSR